MRPTGLGRVGDAGLASGSLCFAVSGPRADGAKRHRRTADSTVLGSALRKPRSRPGHWPPADVGMRHPVGRAAGSIRTGTRTVWTPGAGQRRAHHFVSPHDLGYVRSLFEALRVVHHCLGLRKCVEWSLQNLSILCPLRLARGLTVHDKRYTFMRSLSFLAVGLSWRPFCWDATAVCSTVSVAVAVGRWRAVHGRGTVRAGALR